jgi:hypothetical protein
MLALSLLVCGLVRLCLCSKGYPSMQQMQEESDGMEIPALRAHIMTQWYAVSNSVATTKEVVLFYQAVARLFNRHDSQQMGEGIVRFFYCNHFQKI